MNLKFNLAHADNYINNSQRARILTENWVSENIYCPACGSDKLDQFGNNAPVADFLCAECKSEYELKSKKDVFSQKIVDGAYSTMISRISADNNPHFFFLNYSSSFEIQNFLVIPKHYFVADIIEKRKPLSDTAKRAGWIGCNILLKSIPRSGKIFLVENGIVNERSTVLDNWSKTDFLAKQKQESRGWIIEMLKVIEQIPGQSFTLQDVYNFEPLLQQKFPNNSFVKDKIRQQLQVLRDKGLIEFNGRGNYLKVN